MASLPPVLRYPGSKARIAPWIAAHFPPHRIYVEPFAGSLTVLCSKRPAAVEIANDLDREVITFWQVLRDRPEELARALALTPWSRVEYRLADESTDEPLEQARRLVVRCWQSVGRASGLRSGWKLDLRSNSPACSVWQNLPRRIVAVARRLQGVTLECRPALELIERLQEPEVLLYCDPPYPLVTRDRAYYTQEMSDADHAALLERLDAHPASILLSGYANPLYDQRLAHWERRAVSAQDTASNEKTEVLWINPKAAALLQPSLPLGEVHG